MDQGRLLGRGFHFPPRIDARGRWAWSAGEENIRQSIRIILQTEPLERLMLPEFGGGLGKMLFEPNATATHRLIEEMIRRALTRWEPRISVEKVQVAADETDPNTAVATLGYTVVARKSSEQIQLRIVLNG